jgi:hypothetical protein
VKQTTQVTTAVTIFAFAGAGFVVESRCAFAAPPAQASAASPTKDLARAQSLSLTYQAIAPNLVARTLFSGPAGPVSVEIRDILVGPGQTAELPSGASAALIVVQAGSAAVKVDGKTAEPQTGGVFNVPQGQQVEIDNSRETRPFLARTYAFSATGG